MINAAGLFLGQPQNFKDKFKVYPPTVNDVVNNQKFPQYSTIFLMTQEELEDEFIDKVDEEGNPLYIPTPMEFMLANAYNNKEFEALVCEAFDFFIREKITFLYEEKTILIGNLEEELNRVNELMQKNSDIDLSQELILLTEEEYFDFQNMIRICIGQEEEKPYIFEENEKIRKMKAKARYRDKVKAKQASKKGDTPNLDTILASICCMGIGLNPLNIGEISYASMHKILSTYQKHEKYENDIKSLMVGAKAKDLDFKYWIRNSD